MYLFLEGEEERELKRIHWSLSAWHGGNSYGPLSAPSLSQRRKGSDDDDVGSIYLYFFIFLRDEVPFSPPHPHGQKMRPTDRAEDNGRLPWKCAFSLTVSMATERHTILFL